MGDMPQNDNGSAGFGDSLALFRRLSSQTVASSFQTQSRDQFGAMVYNRSNAQLASLSTPLGSNAVASGNRSTAIGAFANAKEDSSTALGIYAQGFGQSSIAIGNQAKSTGNSCIAIGTIAQAKNISAIAIGSSALASGLRSICIGNPLPGAIVQPQATGTDNIAIGSLATAGGSGGGTSSVICIGRNSNATSSSTIAIGDSANCSGGTQSIAIGTSATTTGASALAMGRGSASANQARFSSAGNDFYSDWGIGVQAHGEFALMKTLTELTTIAAAASTDTVIQIPAKIILKAVTVRTVTVIPTAATYTVTGATSGTVFDTAAVSTAATSTDKGNAAGAFYNATAQSVRITPNLIPAAATGQVRVTIIYDDITPPTS